jgi:hypothetical protein
MQLGAAKESNRNNVAPQHLFHRDQVGGLDPPEKLELRNCKPNDSVLNEGGPTRLPNTTRVYQILPPDEIAVR